jgi:hypothetical protein
LELIRQRKNTLGKISNLNYYYYYYYYGRSFGKKTPTLVIIIGYARSFGKTTTLNFIVEEALKKSNPNYC